MILVRTPFRISFFGGGTDYPVWYEKHFGLTICTTINKYAFISIRRLPPFFDYNYRVRYHITEEVKNLNQIKHPVVREAIKFYGYKKGIEIVHSADLPARSGLGSSSTFTVGFLHALFLMQNKNITKRKLALKAINLEQNIIGESVGSQDQTIASYGGLNQIKFNKSKVIQVEKILLSEKKLKTLEDRLLLCFTGFTRNAEKIAKFQIINTPFKEKELLKILDIANKGKKILLNSMMSLDNFGDLLNEQWHIKKSLSNKISNKSIDDIYDAAIKAGALGGKLLGAGGGGFMLFYARKENHNKIKKALKNKLFVPFKFEKNGSQIIYQS